MSLANAASSFKITLYGFFMYPEPLKVGKRPFTGDSLISDFGASAAAFLSVCAFFFSFYGVPILILRNVMRSSSGMLGASS